MSPNQHSTIKILPVVDEADIKPLARLAALAMKADPFYAFYEKYSGTTFYDNTVVKLTAALKDTNGTLFKAVVVQDKHQHDENKGSSSSSSSSSTEVKEKGVEDMGKTVGSEVIVGVSQWFVGFIQIPKVDPFASSSSNDGAVVTKTASEPPETISINPFQDYGRRAMNEYISTIRGKKHVALLRLFVHPDYPLQGIGTRLLQWGKDVADEGGMVTWLMARPVGRPLYEANGWKRVSTLKIEAEGIDVPPTLAMLRQPTWK